MSLSDRSKSIDITGLDPAEVLAANTAQSETHFALIQQILAAINNNVQSTGDQVDVEVILKIMEEKQDSPIKAKTRDLIAVETKLSLIRSQSEQSFASLGMETTCLRFNQMVKALAVALFGIGSCDEQSELATALLLLAECQLPIYSVGIQGMKISPNREARYNHAFVIIGHTTLDDIQQGQQDLQTVLNSFSENSYFLDPNFKSCGKLAEFPRAAEKYINEYQCNQVIWLENMKNLAPDIMNIKAGTILLTAQMSVDLHTQGYTPIQSFPGFHQPLTTKESPRSSNSGNDNGFFQKSFNIDKMTQEAIQLIRDGDQEEKSASAKELFLTANSKYLAIATYWSTTSILSPHLQATKNLASSYYNLSSIEIRLGNLQKALGFAELAKSTISSLDMSEATEKYNKRILTCQEQLGKGINPTPTEP